LVLFTLLSEKCVEFKGTFNSDTFFVNNFFIKSTFFLLLQKRHNVGFKRTFIIVNASNFIEQKEYVMKRIEVTKCMALMVMALLMMPLFCETLAAPPSNYGEVNAGTAENPFLIENLANLRWLSETPDIWGGLTISYHFSQTADIDATETMHWYDGQGFRPIGAYYTYFGSYDHFRGNYNGNNFALKAKRNLNKEKTWESP